MIFKFSKNMIAPPVMWQSRMPGGNFLDFGPGNLSELWVAFVHPEHDECCLSACLVTNALQSEPNSVGK
jgi:hypothetical protein